jgi:dihydroxy-acid dehydratase
VVACSGGSTNGALHLPAIAHECGIEFDLHDVAAIFRDTPYIADLKPAGRYVMRDLAEVGGVPLIMKALLDGGYLHGGCVTVTGRTIAENLADTPGTPARTSSARPSNPITRMGGVVGLKGSLAPEGAMVKVAGLPSLKFRGPARVFDTEEACMEAVQAGATRRATSSSSATRARRAARACARCWG